MEGQFCHNVKGVSKKVKLEKMTELDGWGK